jgi:hypothetical protein
VFDRQGPDYTEIRTVWQTVSTWGNIDEFRQLCDAGDRGLEMIGHYWVSYATLAGAWCRPIAKSLPEIAQMARD